MNKKISDKLKLRKLPICKEVIKTQLDYLEKHFPNLEIHDIYIPSTDLYSFGSSIWIKSYPPGRPRTDEYLKIITDYKLDLYYARGAHLKYNPISDMNDPKLTRILRYINVQSSKRRRNR